MSKETPVPVCFRHARTDAGYQCGTCQRSLCDDCVKPDAHLFFCPYCGGRAQRLSAPADRDIVSIKEALTPVTEALRGVAALLTNHVIVPAAVIVMVGAFLFYLLDVRSVFLGDSSSLKRVGFLFGAATVLIARYGRMYGERGKQIIYTVLLAGATILAMSRYSLGMLNGWVNILVVIAVWRFATSLTNKLEGAAPPAAMGTTSPKEKGASPLYGVERLKHEALEKQYNIGGTAPEAKDKGAVPPRLARKRRKKRRDYRNPSRPVARLSALALVMFAVGEPFILAGPPEIGARALGAVIAFLLAAGVVMAAGSSMGTYRHTILSGGDASLGMVPVKIFIGVALLVMIMAAAFTVPGINYEGSGKIQPTRHRGKGNISGKEQNRGKKGADVKKQPQARRASTKDGEQQTRSTRQEGGKSPSSFFAFLAKLGQLLLIPSAILFVGFLLYALVKLWPTLKGLRFGIGDGLRRWLAKLRGLFRSGGKEKDAKQTARRDPVKLLNTLQGLQPREAVLRGYECLLVFFESIGHRRAERLTPYEFLYTLPERFGYLSAPVGRVTELYVRTAYSRYEPTPADSREIVEALASLQSLIDTRRRNKKT